MAYGRFSHALAEGDGISVIASVEDADSARDAERQRAEALVVRTDPAAVREATSLPILWRAAVPLEQAAGVADAVMLVFDAYEDDEDGRLEELHRRAEELGLDCAVEVRNEAELEQALERVDPEIFLLSPAEAGDEGPIECILDLLAAVPAGKLAIADLSSTTEDEVQELERAGVDGVIVASRDIAALAGDAPPPV
jgi:indole-3-glycerol phosphate synthase